MNTTTRTFAAAAEIVEDGHYEATVCKVTRLVDVAEFKRRQCPPGVRVSTEAFGKERRMSITATNVSDLHRSQDPDHSVK